MRPPSPTHDTLLELLLWCLCLLVPACAGMKRRYGPAGDCRQFCSQIRGCALKAHHGNLAGLLCRTARCETGERCTGDIDSPDRQYAGAFQFLASTWKARCEPLFPALGLHECRGSEARYDTCCAAACAAEIMATRGVNDWPVCGPRARRSHASTS